jgi:YfiH family protein
MSFSHARGSPESVSSNIKNFLESNRVDPNRVVAMAPQGRDQIHVVSPEDFGLWPSNPRASIPCDGLLTSLRESFLFLAVADCPAIFLYDPVERAAGLVHAGWQGTGLRIVEKAMRTMGDTFGTKAINTIVYVGPCIMGSSYWFPIDSIGQLEDPDWQPYLFRFDDEMERIHIDLLAFNKAQLDSCGVPAKNIYISPIDTYRDENYFSHMRSAIEGSEEGRFGCILGLR